MASDIKIEKKSESDLHKLDFTKLPFGRVLSDHLFYVEYEEGEWKEPSIIPYQPISFTPAAAGLHYGQSVFEGLKAFKSYDHKPVIFRPEDNFKRMNLSARRMCMPEIPREFFMDGMRELVNLDQAWIPDQEGSALYIRPLLIATEKYFGIKPSDYYCFLIFTSPVPPYYPKPLKVRVEENYVRAFKGGVGYAKAAGNYGASLYPTDLANKEGYDQVIWTDGVKAKEMQEFGTMNLFVVINGTVITPPTDDGTILEGITRNSAIEVLKLHNYPVVERKITIDELVEAYDNGELEEVFGTGTAATIAQISHIGYRDKYMELPPVEDAEIANFVFKKLERIKRNIEKPPYDWLYWV